MARRHDRDEDDLRLRYHGIEVQAHVNADETRGQRAAYVDTARLERTGQGILMFRLFAQADVEAAS